MAPKGYQNTYQTYKALTDKLTTWLVHAARLCDLGVALTDKGQVPIKEFVNLATAIVASTDPSIPIPKEVLILAENAISLRTRFSKSLALLTGTSPESAAHASHKHFISVLQRTLGVLRTGSQPPASAQLPKEQDEARQRSGDLNISNMFAALNVEEPKIPTRIDNSAKTSKAIPTTKYELETSTEDTDMTVIISSLNDIDDIRMRVREVWFDYREGALCLMSAAVTTDTAYGMIRRICEELNNIIPGDRKYWTMCQRLQASQIEVQSGDKTRSYLETADLLAIPTEAILSSFAQVLRPSGVPVYKPGHFGQYDPLKWGSHAPYHEKYHNDLILLMEYLPEVTKIARKDVHLPVQDDMTAGLRILMDACDIYKCPMYAIFATHMFLDMHHALDGAAHEPFNELQNSARQCVAAIDRYFEFTGDRRIMNWPPQNDQVFRSVKALAQDWALADPLGPIQLKCTTHARSPSSHFFKSNPVVAGLLMFRLKLLMQDAGQTLCGAWGTVMYPIHLYNACRQSGGLAKEWEDFEYLYQIHTASRFLVGAPPTAPQEYLRRFLLALGGSARNFARNRRQGGSRIIVESKKGPRGMKTTSPVKDVFMAYYNSDGEISQPVLSTQNAIAMLAVASKAQRTNAPTTDLESLARSVCLQSQITPLQMLSCVMEGVAAEEMHLQFDYIGLHQRGLTLLRKLKARVHNDLVKYFGQDYLEDESQLPYVIGYIFEVAAGSDKAAQSLKLGAHGSRLIHVASEVIEEYLSLHNNGAIGLAAARGSTRIVQMLHFADQLDQLEIWDPQRRIKEEK